MIQQVKPAFYLLLSKERNLMDMNTFQKRLKLGAVPLCAKSCPSIRSEKINFVTVKNSAQALGIIASNFFGKSF